MAPGGLTTFFLGESGISDRIMDPNARKPLHFKNSLRPIIVDIFFLLFLGERSELKEMKLFISNYNIKTLSQPRKKTYPRGGDELDKRN